MPAFSQDIFDKLCERIADGESLRKICNDPDMPSTTAVMKWLAKDGNGQLVAQYARAREMQADALFDECLDIADDGTNDWVEDQDGGEKYNGDHVQRSRLRIDTRKWMAGKLRPKVYGDKLAIGGGEDMPPIKMENVGNDADAFASAISGLAARMRDEGASSDTDTGSEGGS